MRHWGVKSYEWDDADRAIDAGFERVHGAVYEDMMDDRNPLSFEQVQQRLASPETLAAAVGFLRESYGGELDDWRDEERLAFAGVVVRHAEFGTPVPDDWRRLAVEWLEGEEIEWEEATRRNLRRKAEIALLSRSSSEGPS